MNYRIKASDVAAIVGKNPYKSREDILFQYIHGKSKDDIVFESALNEQPEETQELIKNTIQQSKKEDIVNTEEKIQALPEKVKEYVKHEIYKNNGTHRERRVAETHNVKRDTKWYSMKITEDVRLVGLIDGRRGEDSIIEIKNRQKRMNRLRNSKKYQQEVDKDFVEEKKKKKKKIDDRPKNTEDRKSTRLNSSHVSESRMPSSA